MKDRKLIFVYRRSGLERGSTQMRAHQLVKLIAPHIPEIDLDLRKMSTQPELQRLWARFVPRGAVLFFTKTAARVLDTRAIDILKSRGCKICLDFVDTSFARLPKQDLRIDAYVSPSISGVKALKDRIGLDAPIHVVLHSGDSRLYGSQTKVPEDRLRPVYWGKPSNWLHSDAISERVTLLDASTVELATESIKNLPRYNMHYCVRPAERRESVVPFTKGANAALLGAPVLVSRDVQDAEELLGADYPYMIEEPTERAALEMLERAKSTFGGAEWQLAKERMTSLAAKVSPNAIAAQMCALIKSVTEKS